MNENLTTLEKIISEYEKYEKKKGFIYRGCAYECYKLIPTLARKLKPDTSFEMYSSYAANLERAAQQGYVEVGMAGDPKDLSQHYGLSTIYLDWSYSVYVALYFAFTSYIKSFLDGPHPRNCPLCEIRNKFNDHKYCLYKLNKNLYDEMRSKYHDLPLEIFPTDNDNERMKSQKGLLSTIHNMNDKIKIQTSQIQILADWFNSKHPDDSLKKEGDKYLWNNGVFLEKLTYKLPQEDRQKLQKTLKKHNATSTKLFPDFEGVKNNLELSEDYNILIDLKIAYCEPPLRQNFTPSLEKLYNQEGSLKIPKKGGDQLNDGEFFTLYRNR